jgi:hypothetical protein
MKGKKAVELGSRYRVLLVQLFGIEFSRLNQPTGLVDDLSYQIRLRVSGGQGGGSFGRIFHVSLSFTKKFQLKYFSLIDKYHVHKHRGNGFSLRLWRTSGNGSW